jgi:hypothetical protein
LALFSEGCGVFHGSGGLTGFWGFLATPEKKSEGKKQIPFGDDNKKGEGKSKDEGEGKSEGKKSRV